MPNDTHSTAIYANQLFTLMDSQTFITISLVAMLQLWSIV